MISPLQGIRTGRKRIRRAKVVKPGVKVGGAKGVTRTARNGKRGRIAAPVSPDDEASRAAETREETGTDNENQPKGKLNVVA